MHRNCTNTYRLEKIRAKFMPSLWRLPLSTTRLQRDSYKASYRHTKHTQSLLNPWKLPASSPHISNFLSQQNSDLPTIVISRIGFQICYSSNSWEQTLLLHVQPISALTKTLNSLCYQQEGSIHDMPISKMFRIVLGLMGTLYDDISGCVWHD